MGFLSNKIWVRIFLGHPVLVFVDIILFMLTQTKMLEVLDFIYKILWTLYKKFY